MYVYIHTCKITRAQRAVFAKMPNKSVLFSKCQLLMFYHLLSSMLRIVIKVRLLGCTRPFGILARLAVRIQL